VPLFTIREATQADAPGMAKVRVDTWRDAYRGILPGELLAGLSYQATAERWQKVYWEAREPGVAVFVAENEHQEIVGIAICGPEQSQDPIYQGEIYVLYVLPQYQRQGIGRRLVERCIQHLVDELKFKTMLIWVIAENPYRRFYEMLGGKASGEKTKDIGGKMVVEVGYGWETIDALAKSKLR
jgi:ribosomal protein S18 acetylase RimI-like enzyme